MPPKRAIEKDHATTLRAQLACECGRLRNVRRKYKDGLIIIFLEARINCSLLKKNMLRQTARALSTAAPTLGALGSIKSKSVEKEAKLASKAAEAELEANIARHQAAGTDYTIEVQSKYFSLQHKLIPYRIIKLKLEWAHFGSNVSGKDVVSFTVYCMWLVVAYLWAKSARNYLYTA